MTLNVEKLAKVLHEAGREAVEKKATVNPNIHPKFLEWDELEEHMKEGRRIQARYILQRYILYEKSNRVLEKGNIYYVSGGFTKVKVINIISTQKSIVKVLRAAYGSKYYKLVGKEVAVTNAILYPRCGRAKKYYPPEIVNEIKDEQ